MPHDFIRFNLKILRAMNSCQRDKFVALFDEALNSGFEEIYFTSKKYLWNIIRGKDYYKMLSYYVVEKLNFYKSALGEESLLQLNSANWLIHKTLETTEDYSIRKSFIWSIMKQIPLLTIDTIQYASPEKIHSILTSPDKESMVVCDDFVRPFLNEYRTLHEEISSLQQQIQMMSSLIEDM